MTDAERLKALSCKAENRRRLLGEDCVAANEEVLFLVALAVRQQERIQALEDEVRNLREEAKEAERSRCADRFARNGY